jgi:hypothetical protein
MRLNYLQPMPTIYKYLKYKAKGRIKADMKKAWNSEKRYSAFKISIRDKLYGRN